VLTWKDRARDEAKAEGRRAATPGRFQAQGGGTEKSAAWAQKVAPTESEMRSFLNDLWNQLTRAEQRLRKTFFVEAHSFLVVCAEAGAIAAPVSKTWKNWKSTSDVRLDLEVQAGVACVPDE